VAISAAVAVVVVELAQNASSREVNEQHPQKLAEWRGNNTDKTSLDVPQIELSVAIRPFICGSFRSFGCC
jgi:hypothetical protein